MNAPRPFKRDTALFMDLYELTMANGYFRLGMADTVAAFDMFYRKNPDSGGFTIFAGLEQAVDYVENLRFTDGDIGYLRSLGMFSDDFLEYLKGFRFTGDVYAFEEGTIAYPNEPLITVVAPLIEAQIVETAILSHINHQSLIATKANRIVRAAAGRSVSDMGARRAHNMDAAIYGARAAYIGGVAATATVMAGKMFDIPVTGTMAHSWIMSFDTEYDAFASYARIYGSGSVFLVDTYDTLKSGIPNAIRVAHEILHPAGQRLKAVRVDSGDIAYLSKKARRMFDDAGMNDCKIVASNSLDEWTIKSIIAQGGKVDIFGVGERLITAKSDPTFGGVYKLVAIKDTTGWVPKIKMSENVGKITNPGIKDVYRIYDDCGRSRGDILLTGGVAPADGPYILPERPWEEQWFAGCRFKKLQRRVIKDGKRMTVPKSLDEIRTYVERQLHEEVRDEEKRFENPDTHLLVMEPDYYRMKLALLDKK